MGDFFPLWPGLCTTLLGGAAPTPQTCSVSHSQTTALPPPTTPQACGENSARLLLGPGCCTTLTGFNLTHTFERNHYLSSVKRTE